MGTHGIDDATNDPLQPQDTQQDQEQNMVSERQPVAPSLVLVRSRAISRRATDAFRRLEIQAASERGD